jgi:hypothetical protein
MDLALGVPLGLAAIESHSVTSTLSPLAKRGHSLWGHLGTRIGVGLIQGMTFFDGRLGSWTASTLYSSS